MTFDTEWIVNVPLSNLRKEPIHSAQKREKDPLQETQLLFGERLHGFQEKNGWLFVEAIDQPKFCPQKKSWSGYQGWVKCEDLIPAKFSSHFNLIINSLWASLCAWPAKTPLFDLSFGTRVLSHENIDNWHLIKMPDGSLAAIEKTHAELLSPKPLDRNILLKTGFQFIGFPYLWGGLSPFRKGDSTLPLTGIDCSGLVHLLYRRQGVSIPRDAHDQFLQAKKIPFNQLQPGDPIFLAEKENPNRISHVMLFVAGDEMLEATLDSNNVRIISGTEKLGSPLSEIHDGHSVEKYLVSFGRF